MNLVIALFYLHQGGVAMSWSTATAELRDNLLYVAPWLAGGLALRVVMLRARGQRERARRLLSAPSLILLIRILVVATAVSYAYLWLKLTIPLTRNVLYDKALWNADRFVHFGLDPVLDIPNILSSYGVLGWIDRYYSFFLPSIMMAFGWFATTEDLAQRRCFAFGYSLLWSAGAWFYLAVPALGPCYVAQKLLLPYYSELPLSTHAQQVLWQNYQQVLAARVSGAIKAPFNPGYGIASMPSLHVGAHAFFAFWAWRRKRALFWLFLVLTELTFVGSVATGWHNAVDGYAGLLLAILCAFVARLGEARSTVQVALPDGAAERGVEGLSHRGTEASETTVN